VKSIYCGEWKNFLKLLLQSEAVLYGEELAARRHSARAHDAAEERGGRAAAAAPPFA